MRPTLIGEENAMNWLYCDPGSHRASVALLLVRLVMGVAFILHGWPKIQAPLAWMGPDAPVPAALQLAAAVAEFGGGLVGTAPER